MQISPQQALDRFPAQCVETAGGRVQYRSAGKASAVTHVLLHGIGSGSASWVYQLLQAQDRPDLRLLAWDAPGYGASTPVAPPSPLASDYALRLWQWLDALGVTDAVVLAGHSLGALMAASAACMRPAQVSRVVLLSPARGYGDAGPQEREEKLASRLGTLERLGPQGMAAARGAAMLSPHAAPELIEAVRDTMAQVDPAGYAQAARMLSNGTLLRDVAALTCPVSVASGEADTITPPAGCSLVARQAGQDWLNLGSVGHACPLEAPAPVNALLGLTLSETKEATT
ncbi:alpha/beta fold hydrolase [Hydrogenophaga aquatica]